MRVGAFLKLFASLTVCFGAAMIGGKFTGLSVTTWYTTLNKPFFTPPSAVFAPVWSVLYFLMAVAVYRVWRKREDGIRDNLALLFFGLQLGLNVAWSAVFFGLRSIGGGLFVILILWGSIALTLWRFRTISRFAAMCLLPYWLWVSFAVILNYTIWRLNS